MTSLGERLARAQEPETRAAPAPGAHRRSTRPVDPFSTLKQRIHRSLVDMLGPGLYGTSLSPGELEARVRAAVQETLAHDDTPMTAVDRARIAQELLDEVLGLGPLEQYLSDPEVSEIMVNGPGQIYVERRGRISLAPGAFAGEGSLRRAIEKIVSRVGRRIDESSPMVDARLPDGSRVNAVVPPVALDGSLLTIRKFAADPLTIQHLLRFGTVSPQVADFLVACVRGRVNILISGGTGSGKTTTLNVLSSFIPSTERIVTIEDSAELQLMQEHVLRLESRPPNIEDRGEVTIRDLVRNSLRMRPDRIVVGEVRDGAALDMLQAMNTGHDGSLTTIHANAPREALSRLETMVLMSGMDLPIRAVREQIGSAIDLIIQQVRSRDGVRRIVQVTEVAGMEADVISLQDIFQLDTRAGTDAEGRPLGALRPTGLRPRLLQRLADQGVDVPPHLFVPERPTW